MAVMDLFFKRRKRERGEYSDVYQYEDIPATFRIQIVHILRDRLPPDPSIYHNTYSKLYGEQAASRALYQTLHSILCKELGVFKLSSGGKEYSEGYYHKIVNYFLEVTDTELALTVLELLCRAILTSKNKEITESCNEIDEINVRFHENGIGYQYEKGQIIRVDSQYIHSEAVKPTLQLLSKPMYEGAQDEFLKAHEHYREQRYKEMMVECLKAYESTLKVIIKKHNWGYREKDTADALTGKVMQNNLVPEYWQQYYKGLKNTLTAGLPTARNNEGGHGQGEEITTPPDYLAAYVLHMTASAIVFLANAEENI